MVPLDGLQVREAANGQPLFVPLTAVHHTVNMLRQEFSGLNYHRLIAGLCSKRRRVVVRRLRVWKAFAPSDDRLLLARSGRSPIFLSRC